MPTIPTPTLYAMPQEAVDALAWEPLAGNTGVSHKVIFLGDGVVAGLLRLAPGAKEVPHLHSDGEHHVWVLRGTVVADDTELSAGSYLHVPQRLLHTMRDAGEGSQLFYVFRRPD
ncbi:MAG: cupin domain-containing protein [Mycobacteriales bacterium]